MKITIDRPDKNKIDPDKARQAITSPHFFDLFAQTSNSNHYYTWEKFKRRLPQPRIKNCHLEEVWFAITLLRKSLSFKTIVRNEKKQPYFLYKLTKGERILHNLDLLAGRQIFSSDANFNFNLRSALKRSSLMEEAIASAILEGAHTTRKAAKKMLIENNKPRNKSEVMILNNYITMSLIETEYQYQAMDVKLLSRLHLLLTKNDPDIDKNKRGQYRTDADNIAIGDYHGALAYIPPKAAFLQKEVKRFLSYLNDQDEDKNNYLHPVIKAIIIHFWTAILHPFVDGNGRLARCLFYWYLLKNGYQAIAYIPISTAILKSPVQYANAYLQSEQDGLNMTYFYDYHLDKIQVAINNFNQYLQTKINSINPWEQKLKHKGFTNHRHIQVLAYLLSSKAAYITRKSYMNITGVERITTAKDLKILVGQKWLRPIKEGRTIVYYPTGKLTDLTLD
jgi:Fic family protein